MHICARHRKVNKNVKEIRLYMNCKVYKLYFVFRNSVLWQEHSKAYLLGNMIYMIVRHLQSCVSGY